MKEHTLHPFIHSFIISIIFVSDVISISNLSPNEAKCYLLLVKRAQKKGLCLACKVETKKGAFICGKCHSNAKRAFPNLTRAQRAIQYVETGAYKDVAAIGSEALKEKIRTAWKRKRLPEYNELLEAARMEGCVLCGKKTRYEPLCLTHIQRCKKVSKALKQPTSGRDWQIALTEYCRKILADHEVIRKWLQSGKSLAPQAILGGLSEELFLSQDWAKRYRDVVRYLAKHPWPTESKGKKGYAEAKFLNRTIRASELGTSPDDDLRRDLERLLVLLSPGSKNRT